ncbi:AAA family ATPase [Lewinella sp. W8]|uniref:AAA family ATPase n=1 Tax=Lewinella sp. W8 TaxID=2528208 RepID=UPI001068B5B0|nr:ATP-binding protein [Lewinella sp. W8]MTB53538.1 AAA family ATPase [Lewinella sp. W8]
MYQTPRRILITGPESSGKSTLARTLAWATDGRYVEEVARKYLNQRNGQYAEADLLDIWRAQMAAQAAAEAEGPNYLFFDTGPEVLEIWAKVKFGRCDPRIVRSRQRQSYDLVLLCSPDLPWEPDPLREAPDTETRWDLFEAYQKIIGSHRVIAGAQRVAQALAAVRAMED